MLWDGADPPRGIILENLEKRLDRLEDDLSKLEAREGAATPPRPGRDAVARAAATYAGRRAYEAGRAHRDLRKKVVMHPGRWPDCLRAEAKHLRLQVEARNAHDLALRDSKHGTTDAYRRQQLTEREDMLELAARLEQRAEELECDDRRTQAAARRQELERMTTEDLRRLSERNPKAYDRLLEECDLAPAANVRTDALGRGRAEVELRAPEEYEPEYALLAREEPE